MVSSFSSEQQIILACVPVFSGLMSTIGSMMIIFIILKDAKKKLKKTYHRLLLGLSLSDILNSIRAMFSAFLMPSGTTWGAFGNRTTCSALGFFAQLGISSSLYSASLAIYYYVRIQSKSRRKNFRHFEPAMQVFSILYPLVTAIWGLFLDIYNPIELGTGCWVSAYPTGCRSNDLVECTRGSNAAAMIWVFGGIVLVALGIVIFCMTGVYLTVRGRLQAAGRRYSNQQASRSNTGFRIRQTRQQATLYVSAFLLTYAWTFASRIVENKGRRTIFVVTVLAQVFFPSQGLFNAFIYIRPRYIDLHQRFPSKSFMSIVFSILGDDLDDQPLNNSSGKRKYHGSDHQREDPSSIPPDQESPDAIAPSTNDELQRRLSFDSSPQSEESDAFEEGVEEGAYPSSNSEAFPSDEYSASRLALDAYSSLRNLWRRRPSSDASASSIWVQ